MTLSNDEKKDDSGLPCPVYDEGLLEKIVRGKGLVVSTSTFINRLRQAVSNVEQRIKM